jgi:hypothetical protein
MLMQREKNKDKCTRRNGSTSNGIDVQWSVMWCDDDGDDDDADVTLVGSRFAIDCVARCDESFATIDGVNDATLLSSPI